MKIMLLCCWNCWMLKFLKYKHTSRCCIIFSLFSSFACGSCRSPNTFQLWSFRYPPHVFTTVFLNRILFSYIVICSFCIINYKIRFYWLKCSSCAIFEFLFTNKTCKLSNLRLFDCGWMQHVLWEYLCDFTS